MICCSWQALDKVEFMHLDDLMIYEDLGRLGTGEGTKLVELGLKIMDITS